MVKHLIYGGLTIGEEKITYPIDVITIAPSVFELVKVLETITNGMIKFEVYFAMGISRQIQHMVGINGLEAIIALV